MPSQQGKEIRPLERRNPDGTDVPDELRKPQWLDFRSDDDFDAKTAVLLQAMSVNADWARRHTRLSLRATEWDVRERDGSFLLRGSDLREAEAWRDEQSGKQPPPTELQLAYVSASGRAAARRRRTTFGAVVVALAVAVVLAVLAVLQRNQAIDQRNRAVSLALTSAAERELATHPDVSLLLGLEAYRKEPSVQARSSLISALETVRASRTSTILHDRANAVAYSPDGSTLAAANVDGTVSVWDARSHEPLTPGLSGHTGEVPERRPQLRRTHARKWRGRRDDRLWDIRTGESMGGPLRARDWVNAVAFSGDGQTLASGHDDGSIQLWGVRTRKPLGDPLLEGVNSIASIAFSVPATLAAGNDSGTLWLWNTRTRRQLGDPFGSPEEVNGITAVALSPEAAPSRSRSTSRPSACGT